MLTADDAKTLSPPAIALANEIIAALAPDGDGGKKIARAEGKAILVKLDKLIVVLVGDLLD